MAKWILKTPITRRRYGIINKRAVCRFHFPINDPSKQVRRLPDYQIKGPD